MKKLALLALALSACTAVDSDNILTSGMFASMSARATGDGTTTVEATLFLGNPSNLDYIDLTADDQLVASHDGDDKVMVEQNVLNVISHFATFQTEAEGAELVVDFQRTVDDGAPESVLTLPAPFELDPVAASISRAQPMTLSWTPGAADLMKWNATGDCIEFTFEPAIAAGADTLAIAANTIHKRQDMAVADTCLVTVTMTRSRFGDIDPNYGEGGSAVAEQVRTLTFTSTP
ncbi:MAG: hypothetical protein ABI867_25095 [Kofleriaceae bacterium]